MQIYNFTVSTAIAALGEQVTVSFDVYSDVRLEYGLTINLGKLKKNIRLRDEDWVLRQKTSEHVSFTLDIASADGSLENTLSTSRAVAEATWTVSSVDTVGTPVSAQISNPITYINVRCAPTIDLFKVERSSGGKPDESGIYLMLGAKLALTANADQPSMKVLMHYAENGIANTSSPYIDLTDDLDMLLGGVTDDVSIIDEMTFSNASAWEFLLVFGDEYESASLRRSFSKAFANVHFSGRKNGGVAFGCFSSATDNNPMFECRYPSHFYNPVYFHGGIALGGMKDFSAEEVDTGVKWLNGKKIYAKILIQTGAAGNGTSHSLDLPEGVEMAWLDTANSFHINYNGLRFAPGAQVGNILCFVVLMTTTEVSFTTGLATGGDFYIRVFYTKTDDAPEDISAVALYDADGMMVADADGNTVVLNMTYASRYSGSQIDAGIEKAFAMEGLPGVNEADNGKILTVVDGAWIAADLPKYDGEYSVTPAVEEQTLLTSQKYLDANLKIEKIPYSEVTNTANGTTATIG